MFFLFALLVKSVRPLAKQVLSATVSWQLILPFLAYFIMVGLCVALADKLGLMTLKLFGSVLIWVIFTGIALLFRLTDVLKGDHVFRSEVLGVVGLGAVFALFLGAKTFAFPCEILIVLLVTIVTVLRVVATHIADAKSVAGFIDVLLSAFTLWLLWMSVADMIRQGSAYDWRGFATGFIMPILLLIVTLAYLFILSCYAGYEMLISRLKAASANHSASYISVAGASIVLGLRPAIVNGVTGRGWFEMQEATSFRAGMRAAHTYLDEKAARIEKERQHLHDLTTYAGVQGSDTDGRQYDRREFRETKKALEWLSTCHMGWYRRRDGSYDPNIVERISGLFDNYELPAEHGVVMKVSSDGQSWYGYRRTVTGWVFGIGANGAPPNRHYFDGPEPPSEFPGDSSVWADESVVLPNWRDD